MTENSTVQMINARDYEDQGLVEYNGPAEDLGQWVEAVADYDVSVVSRLVQGWEDYTAVVAVDDGEVTLYYLTTAEGLRGLGVEAYRWDSLELVSADGDALTSHNDRDKYIALMGEYRRQGGMHGWFFAQPLPGQDPDPESMWTWGPDIDQIDWQGLDEALLGMAEVEK
jgi:hypothetical protein